MRLLRNMVRNCAFLLALSLTGLLSAPLHDAIARGRYFAARDLVRGGANVNEQNEFGLTPLHLAVVRGKLPTVRLLLKDGANPRIADNQGTTPLHLATSISYFKRPTALGATTATGLSTAAIGFSIHAAKKAYAETVESVVAIASQPQVPLHEVIQRGTDPRVIKAKESIDFRKNILKYALIALAALAAADIGVRNAILGLLIKYGANPNAQDKDGNTPLHILANGKLLSPGKRRGGILMAQHLIARGADVLNQNHEGKTPYALARRNHRWLLMRLLKPKARPRKA